MGNTLNKQIANVLIAQLTDDERANSVLYADETLYPIGKISIGGTDVEIDSPAMIAFIDQQPGDNWMHPCRYLLINPANSSVKSIESSHPPIFGILPSNWKIIWHTPEIDEWRFLTTATQ